MFSTLFIDVSLIFVQLGLENFGKRVRDPLFYYLCESTLPRNYVGKIISFKSGFTANVAQMLGLKSPILVKRLVQFNLQSKNLSFGSLKCLKDNLGNIIRKLNHKNQLLMTFASETGLK